MPVRVRPSAPNPNHDPGHIAPGFSFFLRGFIPCRRLIRILSWNVNGIRAVHKKGFVDWLLKENPDVLCVQETKATEDQLSKDLLTPNGYASYWSSASRKGYSGVAAYSKIPVLDVKHGMDIPEFDSEGRFLQLDFGEFILLNVYFPNGKMNTERLKFKLDFYDAFLNYIEKLRAQRRKIVFLGDVNTAHNEIDLARPKENSKVSGFLPIERQWIDKAITAGYLDTFRTLNSDLVQYSWWDMKSGARSRNIGWRIDYVFVSPDLETSVKRAFILTDVEGSDHCPVGIELETQTGF